MYICLNFSSFFLICVLIIFFFTTHIELHCFTTQEVHQDENIPNIDPDKRNKSDEHLVEHNHCCENVQFPGNQKYFKDFIIAAKHQTTFIEQLKLVLSNKLIEMNDSSNETLNLSTIYNDYDDSGDDGRGDDDDDNKQQNQHDEYIVKPNILSTLCVLAKFLGLIMAHPFIYEHGLNTNVDNSQIVLRNKV